MLIICTKFHGNTSDNFNVKTPSRKVACQLNKIKIIKLTKKITMGHNSMKNVDDGMVLVLCTASDDCLYQ